MGYTTKEEVIMVLANALTQGSPSTPGTLVDLTTIGKQVTDAVSDEQLYQYIRFADQGIDAAISSIYRTPLQRINRGTFELAADVTIGDTHVHLTDATRFTVGDTCMIRERSLSQKQTLTVVSISGDILSFGTTPITSGYSRLTARVERILYPDPISKISAKMAAATLFDKHFAAQVDGNQSEFSKVVRGQAIQDLNNILSGTIRLDVPDISWFVGDRYCNTGLHNIVKTYAKAEEWFKQ